MYVRNLNVVRGVVKLDETQTHAEYCLRDRCSYRLSYEDSSAGWEPNDTKKDKESVLEPLKSGHLWDRRKCPD